MGNTGKEQIVPALEEKLEKLKEQKVQAVKNNLFDEANSLKEQTSDIRKEIISRSEKIIKFLEEECDGLEKNIKPNEKKNIDTSELKKEMDTKEKQITKF